MQNPTVRPSRLVIAIDDSEFAQSVVEGALDTARRLGAADMHFLRVVSSRGRSLRDVAVDEPHRRAKELIHEVLAEFGDTDQRDGWSVQVHVVAGRPAEEILNLAADVEADLLVIGRWGQETPRRSRLGSIAAQVVAHAGCPVLIHQPTDYGGREAAEVCLDCAAIRRGSRGERWFCANHEGDRGFRSTTLISSAFTPTGGASQF